MQILRKCANGRKYSEKLSFWQGLGVLARILLTVWNFKPVTRVPHTVLQPEAYIVEKIMKQYRSKRRLEGYQNKYILI